MKKSNLYFIYGLLFAIISNVADNKIVIILTGFFAASFMIISLVLSYFEDKYN